MPEKGRRRVVPTERHHDARPCDHHSHPRSQTNLDRVLRCVSSGYLADGCSCKATVPASVAARRWARELERAAAREDRFFRFLWHGGAWLGYGLRDGRVRGVYCPEHSARRAERSFDCERRRGLVSGAMWRRARRSRRGPGRRRCTSSPSRARVAPVHLAQERRQDSRAGRAHGVAEGDARPVHVDALEPVVQLPLAAAPPAPVRRTPR